MLDDIADHMRAIFKSLGYDLTDPHIADSPERIAKYLAEWHTQGEQPPKLTTFPNVEVIDEMIVTSGIQFYSMCAHHGLPFHGVAAIGYIPGDSLLGLSKFARVVDHFANRYSVQERVTKQIADYLESALKPKGLGVVIRAEHLCMSARGVKKPGHSTVTCDLRGAIHKDAPARHELLALVRP